MDDLRALEIIAAGCQAGPEWDFLVAHFLKLKKLRALGYVDGVIGPKNVKLRITSEGRREMARLKREQAKRKKESALWTLVYASWCVADHLLRTLPDADLGAKALTDSLVKALKPYGGKPPGS